ncbi:hypothetical protein GCM10009744_53320 [Kribbella alba]|uniref:Uncharacterized protein n=1 Tax=Kribbella alba TaxID=190197 RepID=A0ABN2FMZ2_9ACTN
MQLVVASEQLRGLPCGCSDVRRNAVPVVACVRTTAGSPALQDTADRLPDGADRWLIPASLG